MIVFVLLVPITIIFIFIIYGLFFREDINSRIEKAEYFINEGNLDIALNILKDLVIKHKDNPKIHFLLGDIYDKKGIYELAEQEYNKVLALKKFAFGLNEPEIRIKLGDVYYKDKKIDEALKEFIIVTQFENFDIRVYIKISEILIEKKNYREAINYIEKFIKIDPTSAFAYFLLGKAYFCLEQLNLSETNLLNAIKIDNQLSEAHLYLGLIFSKKGEYDKSLKELEYPQKDKNYKFLASYEKGKIFQFKGIYETAINNYKNALEIGTEDKNEELEIKYLIAECYSKLNKFEEALSYYKSIYNTNPNYRDVRDKILSYQELKDVDIFTRFLKAPKDEFIKISQKIVEFLNFNISEIDLGKDGILDIIAFKKEEKGTENYLIEIIRFESEVGELTLREMNSKMQDLQIYRGICICTSKFTENAILFTRNRAIELIDKEKLSEILEKIKL